MSSFGIKEILPKLLSLKPELNVKKLKMLKSDVN